MTGVFSGLRVLDLSWGIAGPLTAMMLADSGADVIKVEQPGGDRFREQLGYKVWQRGKRSVELDLKNAGDLETFRTLVAHADILVESFAAGKTKALGIDYDTLRAINPRLIYTSITAYGRDMPWSNRPGYDILVAARTGLNWEHRGWPETAMVHQMGTDDVLADLETNYDILQGPPREGPVMTASPAPSLGAFYAALTAINAALLARDKTGEGQLVETSLFQGALAAGMGVWQRAENSELPGFNSWVFGSKGPKGHFLTSDDRWVHNWVPSPRFIIEASKGDTINSSPNLSVQNDPDRFGMTVEETFVITHYQPILAEAVRKYTADEWLNAAAVADVTLQEARSPETALADPLLLADGCVRELIDPELGAIRQVGVVLDLEKIPYQPGGPAPVVGQHNAEVRKEAATLTARPVAKSEKTGSAAGRPPLEGVKVIDLGLAIAGPFGTQLLSDLGAEVIKINTPWDSYWHSTNIAMGANRGKKSLCIDLKNPAAMEVFHRLVKEADIVQHNMRYEAAVRLGVDYESLKKVNPGLIYCHTRGHERGPRASMPGNDQTGACIAGVQYEDGAIANGGKPFWSLTSFGDTGNGFLSAVGLMQALYHRDRTGEGQFVGTSIVNAQLLNCSYVLGRADGSGFDRPRLDRLMQRTSALYGLYETKSGWLAIVASNDAEWQALRSALGSGALDDARYADARSRWENDASLQADLEKIFKERTAEEWFAVLDAAGAPCEIANPEGGRELFRNEEAKQRKWLTSYRQALAGLIEERGLIFDLSETPGVIQGPALVVGDHTQTILEGLGYSAAEIAALYESGAAANWKPGDRQIFAFSSKQNIPAKKEADA